MSKNKETIEKEERIKFTKRVIDILLSKNATVKNPLVLNRKEYKKITFSGEQLIDAMEEFGTPKEKMLIPTDRTTLYKNEYNDLRDKAKKLKINPESTDNNSLTELQQEQKIKLLAAEVSILKEEIQALENIINTEEIRRNAETHNELFYSSDDSLKNKQSNLLIELIDYLMEERTIFLEGETNGNQSLYFEGMKIKKRLCSIGDLEGLDFKIIKVNGINQIKTNNLIEK